MLRRHCAELQTWRKNLQDENKNVLVVYLWLQNFDDDDDDDD